MEDKFNLGLDFPNLPYLIDGDLKITQSLAILRYLGRKFGLIANGEKETTRVDMIEQEILDWRTKQSEFFYNSDHDNLKAAYVEALKGRIKSLSTFLGDNEWCSGGPLTYVDFLVYEWVHVNQLFYPELLTGMVNVENYQRRIESLPNVAAYIKSDKFIKWPVTAVMAKWGGK